MHFLPLVGNEFAKAFLSKLAQGHTELRALLFSGPRGVGKSSFAIAFLQELFGEEHAKKIAEGTHPDVKRLKPEGKSRLHPVSAIKEMIEDASISPFAAKRKVYLIEEADRMLPASSNTLLKTLEEPPAHAFFILMTAQEEEVLPTILSRCAKVPFFLIEEDKIKEALEKAGVESALAKQAAMVSNGSFAKALEVSSGTENTIREDFLQILSKNFMKRPSFALIQGLEDLDKLLDKQEDKSPMQLVEDLFSDLLFWIRDLHYLKVAEDEKGVFHTPFLSELKELSTKKIPSLEKVSSLIEKGRFALQRNTKPKVVLEKLLSELS
jgi:DNA polymerase III subunit delta'